MLEINPERNGNALPRPHNRGKRSIDFVSLSLDLDVTACGQALEKVVTEQRWVIVHEIEYEKQDELRIQGITRASKKCRKLMLGTIDWSPTAHMLREIIFVLEIMPTKSAMM
jgi:hypothetical protein